MDNKTQVQLQLKEICERYHVDILYAFGSRSQEVKNYLNGHGDINTVSSSDVDIGVKIAKDRHLSVRAKVTLAIELEDILGVNRVDMVVLGEADPFVAANVIRGERLYCRDEYEADEYELYILRRAGDCAHLERERMDLIFRKARSI